MIFLIFIRMKKSFLLLSLLWGALSAWAHDAEVDGIFYNLDAGNKTATVTFKGDEYDSYEGEYAGDVVIPETVTFEGFTYSVTSLGDRCFEDCSSLTSITIPNSVTSLGQECFSDCSSLTSITIPNTVTSLGQGCFAWCSRLTSIYMLPSTPPSTGYSIFGNTPLETVYVVDEDAKTAYQAQDPWRNYGIVVMPLPDVQLSVGATGYATLYYSNYDLVVPENTVAYTFRSENGALTESETYAEGTVIPAGEAVVVHTTNGVPCTLNFKQGTALAACDANSQLAGTDEETAITPDADYYFYGLSLNSSNDINSVGFYWMVADGAAFTNGAHKAYLKIRKSEFAGTQPAKAFAFNGTTTGVESVESSNNVPQAIYDLTGRRVSKAEKGIYIINGKKVIK